MPLLCDTEKDTSTSCKRLTWPDAQIQLELKNPDNSENDNNLVLTREVTFTGDFQLAEIKPHDSSQLDSASLSWYEIIEGKKMTADDRNFLGYNAEYTYLKLHLANSNRRRFLYDEPTFVPQIWECKSAISENYLFFNYLIKKGRNRQSSIDNQNI